MLLVLAFACFVAGCFIAAQATTKPAREARATLQRAVAGAVRADASPDAGVGFRERVLVPARERLASIALRLSPRTTVESVRRRLLAAGMRDVSPTAFLAAKVGLAGFGILLMLLVGAASGPAAAVGIGMTFGALGFVGPEIVVNSRIRKRAGRIQASLPDALELLAVSVEAGLGFDAALAQVVEHLDGPLVDELALVLSEMRIGRGRHEALQRMRERVDTAAVSAFVRAVVQAEQLGASIAHTLTVQANDSRARRHTTAEEKAMKAPVKMLFPTVLFIFPSMFLVILGPALLNFAKLFH